MRLYNKSMRRSCFTLIELIVAIATIALLMAVLLPALRRSREQARAVICSSNIKQLLLGLINYENENHALPYAFDDQCHQDPPPGGFAGGSAFDRRGWWWFNFIEGFYAESDNKRTAVQCPSKRLSNPMLEDNVLCGNYGVNQSICKSSSGWHAEFIGAPLPSSSITRSAETLLIVDSGYAMINWWHVTDEPPDTLINFIIEDTAYIPGLCINESRVFWPGQEYDAIYGRHPNKTVNVGFADNHVSRVKADTLLVEKVVDDYMNKSSLWVPD